MSFASISLDQLTVFVAVVEHGSFSAAGRAVGRVQSAVSHAVASLEDELGVIVFDRSGRLPKLTDAGRRLLGEARLVLSQVRSLQQQADELRGGVEPEVALVLDMLFPRERLFSALDAFHRAYPLVTVSLRWALLDDAVQLVRDGEVDFGICNVIGAAEPLVVRPLTELSLIPVCASDHPLAKHEPPQPTDALRKATQIVLAEQQRDRTADQAVLSARTWRTSDLESKLGLLLAGIGWGNMPRRMVDKMIEAGRLVRLHPEPWPAEGHLVRLSHVVRTDRPLGPAARWLTDELAGTGAVVGP
jgi:DNA-binding transcriptional LysR family regulator